MKQVRILFFAGILLIGFSINSHSINKIERSEKAEQTNKSARSLILNVATISATLNIEDINIIFSPLIRNVQLSIIDSQGNYVYQEPITPQIGSGFEKGVFKLFNGFAKSTTYVYAAETSIGYERKS